MTQSSRNAPAGVPPTPDALGASTQGAARFLGFLASIRPAVEAELSARWQRALRDVAPYGPEVQAMAAEAQSLTLRAGKRFRAAMAAAAYTGVAPDAPLEPALRAGVALELLQTYLLIQDDWIDGDPVRRGGASVHEALRARLGSAHTGAASAILAADLTWGLAVDALASAAAPAAAVVASVRLLCRVHQDVVVGQQLDVLGRAEDVERMHALKTGSYTVRGPLALGATLAGAPAEVVAALDGFAAPLGVAFQLRDDLLGTFGAPEATGKPVGNDLRAGKRTAVLAAAEGRLSAEGREALGRVFGRGGAASDAEVAEAAAALAACGARRAVEERLDALCDQAKALAGALPLSAAAREILGGAADALRCPS